MKVKFEPTFLAWTIASIFCFSLLSPKWPVAAAAFIAPTILLVLLNQRKPGRAFIIAMAVLTVSNAVANWRVIPFPALLFIPMILQISFVQSVPYVLYSRLSSISGSWLTTLIFPFLQVLVEYATSFFGGGTWGSIAYTQMSFLPFVQVASVTGIWGLTFMIYWFASVAEYAYRHRLSWPTVRRPVTWYSLVLISILGYGTFRLSNSETSNSETVKVAGITGLNLYLLGIIYEDAFGTTVKFDQRQLTQTSPELQELNRGLAAFIADPFSSRFTDSHRAIEKFCDSMFHLAGREARGGAKIISFSEALMFTFKPVEDQLIARGENFARDHKVTLLLTMASFIPGETGFGTTFIENKAIMINPFGQIEHIFFKNKPVPVVEPSIPGNGEVPVYNSLYGKIATSICYDADFPSLIRKAGQQGAGILLLPSGDWKEISPYHADMSRMRAIENGVSVMRPVSGATLMACDQMGRVVARRNFYDDGDKTMSAYLSINGVPTLYSLLGDYFPWACLAAGTIILFYLKRLKQQEKKGVEMRGALQTEAV